MAKSRTDGTKVSTFADHEVIVQRHTLCKAMTVTRHDTTPDLDAIARVETALAALSSEFAGWMKTECDRLDRARMRVRTAGLVGNAREEFFRAAHDIKGQAATFGYPLAAEVADSLCRLVEHAPDQQRVPPALIDQHVDGVRAIMREDARATGNATAQALAIRLRQVADEFLSGENRRGADDLAAVGAPALVPRRRR